MDLRVSEEAAHRYRLTAVNVTDESAIETIFRPWDVPNARNLSFSAIVTTGPPGIHLSEYHLTLTVQREGDVYRVTRRAAVRKTDNVTVERPAWYDDAVANTTERG